LFAVSEHGRLEAAVIRLRTAGRAALVAEGSPLYDSADEAPAEASLKEVGKLEHPGVLNARGSIDAFNRGDMEALRDFYADDVLWHVAGKHGLSGDYRGRDELIAYFKRVLDLTGGSLKLESEAILASDQHTAIFMRVTGTRNGRSLDVTLAEAFTVGPDGRWTEFWSLATDQDAVDDFWS
jgi:uncharacterized protein